VNSQGETGKPGQRGEGQTGGKGGEGGRGGRGEPTGPGGPGGAGGEGAAGTPGPRGLRGRSGNLGSALTIGIAVALVALFPSTLGLFLLEREVEQGNKDRRIARYTLCIELEKVKRANREEAWLNFNNVRRNARLLNLPVSVLRPIAIESRDLVLAANQQLGGYGRTIQEACVEYARLELRTFPPPPERLNGE
jgi:hypothetical protein